MHSITFGKGTQDGFERFIDWCHALLGERMGVAQHGRSADQHTLKVKEGPELSFVRDQSSEACSVRCTTPLPEEIVAILHDASARAARGDMAKNTVVAGFIRFTQAARCLFRPSYDADARSNQSIHWPVATW
jgi:hypothetical protein